MPAIYNWLVTDPHRKKDFAQFLREACDPANLPLAFMCNAGKDRTAVAALLLLTVLGVPEATIFEDYLMTNLVFGESRGATALGTPDAVARDVRKTMEVMADRWSPTKDLTAYSEHDLDVLTAELATISGADAVNLEETIRAMREAHGSVIEFCRCELGLTAAMEAKLKQACLEPAPQQAVAKL
jgi:hypothetical protein